MSDNSDFETLLKHFERNNATGSLKAANLTLIKILALLRERIDALSPGGEVERPAPAAVPPETARAARMMSGAAEAPVAAPHEAEPVVVEPSVIEEAATTADEPVASEDAPPPALPADEDGQEVSTAASERGESEETDAEEAKPRAGGKGRAPARR